MKFLTVPLCLLLSLNAFARDFRPVTHFENITAADSSVQECYVLQTQPGVRYVVESSHDLSHWTTEDEIYGIGSEYVVTMRQYTPPPPPPPGTPPATLPAPATNVSLRIQRVTGTAGGTVVSWRSLDDGSPVVTWIAGDTDLSWSHFPLYSERYENFYFFLWHPGEVATAPTVNSTLGTKDAAMLAIFEANWSEMNQKVIDSVARSRNQPAPPPPDPNSKKFWRVFCDWSLDTDGDGSPDWAEFEMAAASTGGMVAGVVGDAFNADTNHDGIPDGLQIDSDGDGTPDTTDPDAADNTATFPIGPLPRYALFPITDAVPPTTFPEPFQISDKGTVLYENGTWAGGVWTPLQLPAGDEPASAARAINDNDVILGQGSVRIEADPDKYQEGICYWDNPLAVPSFVSTTAGNASWSYNLAYFHLNPGSVLSNDGHFSAPTYGWLDGHYQQLHVGYWKLPSGSQPASEMVGDYRLEWNQGNNLRWGSNPELDDDGNVDWTLPVKGIVYAPGLLPELPFSPTNVLAYPGSPIIALPSVDGNGQGMAYVNGTWKNSDVYANAIDISKDGTAIGRRVNSVAAPILLNGKWTEINRAAPGVSTPWKDSTVKFLDTTPGGWILAARGGYKLLGIPDDEFSVMLPIKVDGVDPALSVPPLTPPADPPEYINGGVDHTSMTALGGTGRVNEIWIMAPNGGSSNTVRFQSPLNEKSKLTLVSNADVGFSPEIVDNKDMGIQVTGKRTQEEGTADTTPSLKLGGTLDSLSAPLKIKAMKKRTVKVAVHKVFGIDEYGNQTVPANFPTKAALDDYLNEVYGRQTNTFFEATLYDEKGFAGTGIDFDFANSMSDKWISHDITNAEVQDLIVNPKSVGNSATANIDIWVFGGGVRIADSLQSYYGYQIGAEFEAKIMIDGDLLGDQSAPDKKEKMLLNIFAHEIGHVMVGWGHPNKGNCRSALYWKSANSSNDLNAPLWDYADSRNKKRLMCDYTLDFDSKQLIKKEWDLIEAWLYNQERLGKL